MALVGFYETTNHGEFSGLHENYSQWFKNDKSPYHGSEMNIAGCSYKVDSIHNKRINNEVDLLCTDNIDTGSSFFSFDKSDPVGNVSDNLE